MRFLCVIFLFLVGNNAALSLVGADDAPEGAPGGGTSLQFPSDPSIALLSGFTELANMSNFTVEFWLNWWSYGLCGSPSPSSARTPFTRVFSGFVLCPVCLSAFDENFAPFRRAGVWISLYTRWILGVSGCSSSFAPE